MTKESAKAKNIFTGNSTHLLTDLSAEEARQLLMQPSQYCNWELPDYFRFSSVLSQAAEGIGEKGYEECLKKGGNPAEKQVNIEVLLNKDGKYGVRPLTLCNPFMYTFLVQALTAESSWKQLTEHFEQCRTAHIHCQSIPVVPAEKERFHNATIINNWWEGMEQRSIDLSMDYRYLFTSDITNCYGSISLRSIERALTLSGTSKETTDGNALALCITRLLHDMNQGSTVGIPQGSMTFDIVAEIVLSYADLLFSEALSKQGINEGYEVLRYRDDYRIFCNSNTQLEQISYTLQHVLESLGLRMNTDKTSLTSDVLTHCMKPDKLYLLQHAPVIGAPCAKGKHHNLQKHLLYVLQFGRRFPNSGQLRGMLSKIHAEILKGKYGDLYTITDYSEFSAALSEFIAQLRSEENQHKENSDNKEKSDRKEKSDKKGKSDKKEKSDKKGKSDKKDKPETMFIILGDANALCAIALQIALENVTVAHFVLRIIGDIVAHTQKQLFGFHQKHTSLLPRIRQRLLTLPNSDYLKLWLQALTFSLDKEANECPYDTPLCQLAAGKRSDLWDNSWLKPSICKKFSANSIVATDETPQDTMVKIHATSIYDLDDDFDFDGIEETLDKADAADANDGFDIDDDTAKYIDRLVDGTENS